ncbi:PAS domain S-box protein [Qipengyuania zhejiangensis]|uniref:PAS domain S-box protein n=1 Tax=Qipengyuania zhejiangensis TaxID=3077782 RepID=UPI002D77CBC6|nr:PAS domain S-box protein [Qipengyuania sp. Z2]
MINREGIASPAGDDLIGLLLDRVSAAVALFDRDMCYVACNDRWIADYKLGDTDIIGRSHYELFPQIKNEWRELHKRALAGESFAKDVDKYIHSNGTVSWIRWDLAPWHDADGGVKGVILLTEDLTDQIEEDLRSRILTEEMSLFIDIAEDMALCMLDDDGRITMWKSGAERMFGWTEAEAVGQSFECMFDAADRGRGLPLRQLKVARDIGSFRDRCWRIRKDGSRFLGEITISYIEGDKLLPSGFGHVVRDVTGEDLHARSLEASTVLLRSILDTVPDAMIVIDDRGIILSFSTTAEDLFGYKREEIIGQNVSVLMPSPDRELHDEYLARYHETGKPHVIGGRRRVLGLRKDGTVFPHTLRVGEATGGGQRMYAGFLHDLTETEAAEARLQELERELTHIARISEMGTLATAMAHELNQPLMAIGNMVQASSELIRGGGDQEVLNLVAGALEDAGHEAMRAGAIVKRLRSFVSRGELDRTIEDPGGLVRDACELVAADAKLRNIQIMIAIAEEAEAILVDRVQVQQVLLNLVRNATQAIVKDGTIAIDVRPDAGRMLFKVADSGPGVPAERISRLFEPFSTTKPEGMGMGLSICQTIVEAHGGKLWYEGDPDGGAAFLFTMPKLKEDEADAN